MQLVLAYKSTAPINNNKVWLVHFKEIFLFNQVNKYLYINYFINKKVLDIL